MLPAIALGGLANGLLRGVPIFLTLGTIVGNTLQAFLSVAILRKINFDKSLSTPKDMFALIFVAFFASMIVPTVNFITFSLYGYLTNTPYPTPWLSWWLGISMSTLVITPLIIRWVGRSYSSRTLPQLAEISAALLILVVTSVYVFCTTTTSIYGISLLLPLVGVLFWLAFRAGPRFMTLALFLMTAISFLGALYGTHETVMELPKRIFNTQIFDIFLAGFFFVLVSIEEQRRSAIKRLNERNDELQGTVHSISSETAAKNEFIATLAHELRNPLAPLLSSVEMLKLTAQPRSETAQALDLMHGQIKTMTYLLDDLLDISRITQRKLQLKKSMVRLDNVVRHAVETSMPSITERGHSLTVTLPEEPLVIDADTVRMEQILVNLLHNASKYTPPGGAIDLIAEEQGGVLRLLVRDTGIGIDAEMMNTIFEPFVQMHPGGRPGTGIGIGLALTKNLVELHGGTISVSQGPNDIGTEFEILVPVTETVNQNSDIYEKIPRRTSDNPGLSILVVDDNQKAADALRKLLTLRGHRVSVAYDGESALGSVSKSIPDAALLDIGLPDITGYELAERIRAANINSVLIAVTGYGQDEDKRKAEKAGFDYHLVKPVGLESLEPILAAVGALSMRARVFGFPAHG